MMGIFKSKSTDWFKLFEKSISYSINAARTLQKSFEDGIIDYKEIQNIKSIEHEADDHVHQCLKLVEEAFVTPIDRTDIVEIIKEIENITDHIETISNYTYMMCVKKADEASQNLMSLLVNSCDMLVELMKDLKNYKNDFRHINDLIIEINHIEEVGDKAYLNAMRTLYEFETDAKKIIICSCLYGKLEDALDKCEDVADIVQKIIISST